MSNEKSCVCNVFATPHSKNPVKSSVPSYQNVNFKVIRAHKNHPDTLNGWCAIRQEDNEK